MGNWQLISIYLEVLTRKSTQKEFLFTTRSLLSVQFFFILSCPTPSNPSNGNMVNGLSPFSASLTVLVGEAPKALSNATQLNGVVHEIVKWHKAQCYTAVLTSMPKIHSSYTKRLFKPSLQKQLCLLQTHSYNHCSKKPQVQQRWTPTQHSVHRHSLCKRAATTR